MKELKNYLKLLLRAGTGLPKATLHQLKTKDHAEIAMLSQPPDHQNLTVLFSDQDYNHSPNNNFATVQQNTETMDAMEV